MGLMVYMGEYMYVHFILLAYQRMYISTYIYKGHIEALGDMRQLQKIINKHLFKRFVEYMKPMYDR